MDRKLLLEINELYTKGLGVGALLNRRKNIMYLSFI